MKIDSFQSLLLDQLRELHSAEIQLSKALPALITGAYASELKEALAEHLEQTNLHVERLEEMCKTLHALPRGETSEGMKGLIREGKNILKKEMGCEMRDAAIIAVTQKIEHYEIAAYGTVRHYAAILGHDQLSAALEDTLEEAEDTDYLFNTLAIKDINWRAVEKTMEQLSTALSESWAESMAPALAATQKG